MTALMVCTTPLTVYVKVPATLFPEKVTSLGFSDVNVYDVALSGVPMLMELDSKA